MPHAKDLGRTTRRPLIPAIALAACAALPAGATPPAPSTWGEATSGSHAAASAPPRRAAEASGDYFRDFADLIVRVRSVRWIVDVCIEDFPAQADLERHAYDDWLAAHGRFVSEMEAQFDVVDRYWADASPTLKKDGVTAAALRQRVEARRIVLRDDLRAAGKASLQRRCDAFPEILLSPLLDIERAQPDLVRSVRGGPR